MISVYPNQMDIKKIFSQIKVKVFIYYIPKLSPHETGHVLTLWVHPTHPLKRAPNLLADVEIIFHFLHLPSTICYLTFYPHTSSNMERYITNNKKVHHYPPKIIQLLQYKDASPTIEDKSPTIERYNSNYQLILIIDFGTFCNLAGLPHLVIV